MAQGTITDAPANFVRTGSSFDTSPDANFTGVSSTLATDHLWETGWWFRIPGDASETVFGPPSVPGVIAGDTSTHTWTDVAARGLFSAVETGVVKNTGGPGGYVRLTMAITNLSAVNPLAIEVFNMTDIDVNGATNDVGSLLAANNHIRVVDGANTAEYKGLGAKAFLVRGFGATDVATELSDANVDDFANTGLPFGPGDFTGGYQYSLSIPPSGTRSVTVIIAVNSSHVKGDLNSDTLPDLVFRNVNTNSNLVWFMDGVTRTSSAAITPDPAASDWRIVGVDDFDSAAAPGTGPDGKQDLALINLTTRNVEFWLMDGANRPGAAVPLTGPVLSSGWDLSATGDFNRDGFPDIVWRNFTSQKLVIWTMNETVRTGGIIPTPDQAVDFNWVVVATLDYNDDGHRDFLWYNFTSGRIVTWYMNHDAVRTSGQFTTPNAAGDANWKVVAGGDYSRQYTPPGPPFGNADIVWRNETSGRSVVWHMDGNSVRITGQFTNPDSESPALDWFIVGPK
jgi:hypothetical protein